MPGYELVMICKNLKRPELVQVVKRACDAVMERGGLVQSVNNLGARTLPYIMRRHDQKHKEGHYVIVNFDSPPGQIRDLKSHLKRDTDIIKPNVLRTEEEQPRPCETGPCLWGILPDDVDRKLKETAVFRKL